jgi:hypothetical protein
MEKILIRKVFIISFGRVSLVELANGYIFSFKFILSCQQSDIFPIGVAAGIVDSGGKFATGINNTSEIGGKICRRCR